MKKGLKFLGLFIILAMTAFMFFACGAKPCEEHKDGDGDGKCDACDEVLEPAPCTEHKDDDGDGKCDACGATVESAPCTKHEDDDEDGKCDACGATVEIAVPDVDEITVTKTSSHDRIRTVHPGESITYTFTVRNNTPKGKFVTLTDFVPAYTRYSYGDFEIRGGKLVLEDAIIPKNATETFSYTVIVDEDTQNIGKAITADAAMLGDKEINGNDLYIEFTVNEADGVRYARALSSLENSKFEGQRLMAHLYAVAWSIACPIDVTASDTVQYLINNFAKYTSMIVPGLYGGTAAPSGMKNTVPGKQVEQLCFEDMLAGDFLFVLPSYSVPDGARAYTSDGNKLYDVTGKCTLITDISFFDTINDAAFFAVLRPSMDYDTDSLIRTEPFYEGQTDIEKAIIAAAEAFMLRGDRIQYADTRLVTNPVTYRWFRNFAPEDCTSHQTCYTNCTGFMHDVYYNALGWDYGSFTLANSPAAMKAYEYTLTHNETEQEKRMIEEAYRAELQVGDIVFYTYSGNTHAMLYIGNGNLIHSTGSTYNASTLTEKEEPAIRYYKLDAFFDPLNTSRYFFQTKNPRTSLYIIRPLNSWTGTQLPEASANRMANLVGIFAEKTCSASFGKTVNAGELLTYTFTLFNSNATAKTVTITDMIPLGTTLIKDGAASNEVTLAWTVTLEPGERTSISYTVKISENATDGTQIVGSAESMVGGVPTNCPAVCVRNTLTLDEQAAIKAAALALKGGELGDNPIAIINTIYNEALGIENVLGTNAYALKAALFTANGSNFEINTGSVYAYMIAPSHYGGLKLLSTTLFDGARTRLTRENDLVVGDIIYTQGLKGVDTEYQLYIYLGDGLMLDATDGLSEANITTVLDSTIGWDTFAVLRPSMAN